MTASVQAEAPVAVGRRRALWVVQEAQDGAARGNAGAFAFVLAGYGDAWATHELARGIGAHRTVFALQPPEGDDHQTTSLRTLAALYVGELKRRQPRGPYSLGGYSAGALVALEVARQLQAAGDIVASLFMFDPLIVRYTRFEQLCYRAMELAVAGVAPLARRTRAWRIMAAMVQDGGLRRHMGVLRGEIPQPYDGPVTLVETYGSRFVRPPTFLRDLRRVASRGLERWCPPGTHHGFMRPPLVHTLGRDLDARIAAALERAR